VALRDVVREILETPDEPWAPIGGDVSVGYGQWVSPTNPFRPLDIIRTRNYEPSIVVPVPPPKIFPTVVVRPAVEPERVFVDPVTRAPAVEEPVVLAEVPVIDPWVAPTATVYENTEVPAGIYETNRAETDWDRVYEEYVELNQPAIEEVVNVADFDWGDFAGNVLQGAVGIWDPLGLKPPIQQLVGGGAATVPNLGGPANVATGITGGVQVAAGATCPPVGPKYAKICLATGQVMPLKRRRRRRLLTSSDLADISSLVAIVGKGAATNAVVTRAVSRS